jgi:hypothetical protein
MSQTTTKTDQQVMIMRLEISVIAQQWAEYERMFPQPQDSESFQSGSGLLIKLDNLTHRVPYFPRFGASCLDLKVFSFLVSEIRHEAFGFFVPTLSFLWSACDVADECHIA